MTPEEHENYIARLEQQEREARRSYETNCKTDLLIVWFFLVAVAVGILCYFI